MQRSTRAVVLGCGLAGMLAAKVLTKYVDRVTVLERDALGEDPVARAGLPQHRHAHFLLAGGARALDSVLPGTIRSLIDAGAHRLGFPNDFVTFTPAGWQQRFPERQFAITCSRGFVDRHVRRRVLDEPRVDLLDATEVTGLIGDATRVTGVLVRNRQSGATGGVRADLVVDATGRGSGALDWLAALGAPAPAEKVIDCGLMYSSRIFTAPASARAGFPAVTVALDPWSGEPSRSTVLVPIEGGRWLITLAGTRGAEPPADEAGFARFARSVADPVVADLMDAAEPHGPIYRSRSTVNRRRYYERMPVWPEGFLVVGDALGAFNPAYAHGMSIAAKGALALRSTLDRHGLRPGACRRAQRLLARTVRPAWAAATDQDRLYPGVSADGLTRIALLRLRMSRRLMATAVSHEPTAQAVADIFALSGSVAGLAKPEVLWALVRGCPRPEPDSAPPFTPEELSAHPFLGVG
ncbi:hypothetical protein ALI22I_04515 [Saccharothrix sp. ALI-22-I]|uniref:NAD(P)/FAD-dependent oxidoreductase n=1 Tax=Saccharothrix sp. ALI-22-I TaxID=1933778 RepID=UPI00097C993A|nr:FAD-dependent monooxygenase [Saccharothrix sp. ALI-22-I]ONI92341.1 hypothetical protein ALI22I_04515 [Saccharothrix sp. ALI-22-I]